MEHRSYHPQNFNSEQKTHDGDRRRSTWHPSQALPSRQQPFNEGTNESLLKESINLQTAQDPIVTSNQLAHQSINKQLLQQSTTSGNDFDLGCNDSIYKSSHVSMVGDSMESPTSTIELIENSISCELPIQSTKESIYSKSARNSIASHHINSSPYRSVLQSIVNPSIPQNKAIQTSRQSTKNFNQNDPCNRLVPQSVTIRSSCQSTIHEPIVDASDPNVHLVQSEVWEDDNIPIEPSYASIEQVRANQFLPQSILQNYDLDGKEFESPNKQYEYSYQPINENHFYKDDIQNLQNKTPHKLAKQTIGNPSIQHTMVEHSTQQSTNNPSTPQSIKQEFMQRSMVGQSTHQSTNQGINDDIQDFNRNKGLPYQLHQSMIDPLTQESITDHNTHQSIKNRSLQSFSNIPSHQHSMSSKLNQPSIIMDEDTNMMNFNIWPEEVHRQRSPFVSTRQSVSTESTRQSMANDPIRQSAINKSTRPSTIHGYNMDNQTCNDITQSNDVSKSTRQFFATKSVRPSTTEGRISYSRILESNNKIPSFKSIRQSTTNNISRQSKANNLNNDVKNFEGDDASLLSRPHTSNQQSSTSMSTPKFIINPSIRQSIVTQPSCQSMANKLLLQSIGDQASRQSTASKLDNQSIKKEYEPRGQSLYQEEASLDVLSYQPNHQSMSNRSTQKLVSNRHVQQSQIGNSKFATNGFENDFFLTQLPSKSNRQSTVNRSPRQSQGNKLTQQSTNIRSMRPSADNYQNSKSLIFENELKQSGQFEANQSGQQSIEGLNFESQIFEDKVYPKLRSIGRRLSQQSHEQNSTRPSIVMNSPHQLSKEASNIELQSFENEIQLVQQPTTNRSGRRSQGNRSNRQSMKIKSIHPSTIDHQTTDNQIFEDEIPQNQQSMANRLNRQSMANRIVQQSPTTNLDVEAQISNKEIYPSQISIGEKLARQSQGNRLDQQSTGFKSIHVSRVVNPNLDLHVLDDEPHLIRQSMANRSTRQSQRNRSARQLQGNKSDLQSVGGISKVDDHNIELQILEDDIQLNRSPYISSRQSMANRSHQLSTEDTSTQQSNGSKFMQVSTTHGIPLEPNYFNDENVIKEKSIRSIPQSIENMSFHHPIGESHNYCSEMLESQVHRNDPSYKSSRQSMNEAQASNRSSFDEHLQNQFDEGEFSSLTSYSRDHFEPEINSDKSRLIMESTQNMPLPSRFVTLEVRSNVQKESLDKFLIGGWDSVTLKIPPEMHSLLHGIRKSLSTDNSNLDIKQHTANMVDGNDGQCSANIRILYSGIYNSNQEPINSDLYEQSQISHTHSGSDSSNCPSCNAEKEPGTVRFNIEG